MKTGIAQYKIWRFEKQLLYDIKELPMIYLDYASTTPISEKALQVYTKVAQNYFANPSSLHDEGSKVNDLLETCRQKLSSFIGGVKEGIIFTSGGTEGNRLAIDILLETNSKKKHIITSELEHSSISNYMKKLIEQGYEVTFVSPKSNGTIKIEDINKKIRPDTALISIQHANSEIGAIQSIKSISSLAREHAIFFHCDCVQSLGKIPLNVEDIGADAYTFSSHKVYGPKGCGAIYLDPTKHWIRPVLSTTHENGFRAGTVDVPSITAFVTALSELLPMYEKNQKQHLSYRETLKKQLPPSVQVIESEHQLPHIIGMIVHGIEGQWSMLECNRKGIAISTGSACQVGLQKPSPVITSLGFNEQDAQQFIRVSFGIQTTEEDINKFSKSIEQIIEEFHQ
ncbi:IscS subfamily cysteine desulfurase [Bacillus carboniphilus]|uniref:IscS subfamily cysteine desulfurase n=1 Tax=Bacillus carboniphilus TaxID=86663 RepID=A0ABY9JZU5_9BACI|nr:IscS subfamily cysteine desulfurase [Bacillus carboniphilus]WLR44072.1 IscS subfamily cysteine desulfurase [Bacillus carboniphilus]